VGSDAEMCQIALGPSRTTLQCSKQRRGLKSLYIRLLSGSANVNAGRADKAGCIDEVSHKMHDIESSGGFDARIVQLHEVSCRWNNCQRLSSKDFCSTVRCTY
jgi:hypothetical protein